MNADSKAGFGASVLEDRMEPICPRLADRYVEGSARKDGEEAISSTDCVDDDGGQVDVKDVGA